MLEHACMYGSYILLFSSMEPITTHVNEIFPRYLLSSVDFCLNLDDLVLMANIYARVSAANSMVYYYTSNF